MALSTFMLLCNHHRHPSPQLFHLSQLKHQQRSFKPGCDVVGLVWGGPWNSTAARILLFSGYSRLPSPNPVPPPGSPFAHTSPPSPTRLQKILAESPPPARLDIQLPVISDDFKFQVWRKMFRALMPGTGRVSLWVCVCNCVVDGRLRPHAERPPNPSWGGHPRRAHCPFPLGFPCTFITCAQRGI